MYRPDKPPYPVRIGKGQRNGQQAGRRGANALAGDGKNKSGVARSGRIPSRHAVELRLCVTWFAPEIANRGVLFKSLPEVMEQYFFIFSHPHPAIYPFA
jgi:hypothetical protein